MRHLNEIDADKCSVIDDQINFNEDDDLITVRVSTKAGIQKFEIKKVNNKK
jgi:hypothetical protein